jgi:hypothetical protein
MARKWVEGVISQSPFRSVFSVAYAVQGPKDPPYEIKFIKNEILANERDVNRAKIVYIAAHSSGTFVADEFLNHASPQLLQKIRLVILDGGEISIDHKKTVKHKFVSALKHLEKSRDVDGALSYTLESWNYRLYEHYYGKDFISLNADKSACRTEQDIHDYVVNPQAGLKGITIYAGPKFNLEAAFPRDFIDELQKLNRSDDLFK